MQTFLVGIANPFDTQRLMKGEDLKKILKDEGITLTFVSEMLGFDGDQRLHSALKSDNIKTQLLEDIARVTNKSVCFFYEAIGRNGAGEFSPVVCGEGNITRTTKQVSIGDHSPNVNGDNNNVGDGEAFGKFIDELAAQRGLAERSLSLLESRDRQIDRMLDMMQQMINSK